MCIPIQHSNNKIAVHKVRFSLW